MKPTKDRILVEPLKLPDDAVRGIHIPQAHRERQPSIDCIVVAVGPQSTLDVKVGDRVLIERSQGTDIHQGSRKFKLMEPRDILAIIE